MIYIMFIIALFQYGKALLQNEQDNPSDNLVATAGVTTDQGENQEKSAPEDIIVDEDDEDDEDDNANDSIDPNNIDNQNQESDEPELEGDLQLAWEALEVSQKIFIDNYFNSDYIGYVMDIYCRLGDIFTCSDSYQLALDEYKKCLDLALDVKFSLPQSDEIFIEVYYLIAVAHVYNSKQEGNDEKQEKLFALENYKKCRDALKLWLQDPENIPSATDILPIESSSSSSVSNVPRISKKQQFFNERKESLDEVNETIAALDGDIKSMASSSSSSSSSMLPTTTIGFGSVPSNNPFFNNTSVNSSLFNFGSSSNAQVTNIMQIKKKTKSNDSNTTNLNSSDENLHDNVVATNFVEVTATESPSKRQKIENNTD